MIRKLPLEVQSLLAKLATMERELISEGRENDWAPTLDAAGQTSWVDIPLSKEAPFAPVCRRRNAFFRASSLDDDSLPGYHRDRSVMAKGCHSPATRRIINS